MRKLQNMVIGKVLEEFDGTEGEQGRIVIFVNLGWWGGPLEEERQLVSSLTGMVQR
jgi:carbohydrate-selective porin OprB